MPLCDFLKDFLLGTEEEFQGTSSLVFLHYLWGTTLRNTSVMHPGGQCDSSLVRSTSVIEGVDVWSLGPDFLFLVGSAPNLATCFSNILRESLVTTDGVTLVRSR